MAVGEERLRELAQKKMRIEHFLTVNQLDALIISRQNNFAWATAGGSNWVSISAETGVASLVFKPGGEAYLVTDNLEVPRFEAEEHTAEIGLQVAARNWWASPQEKHEHLLKVAGGGKNIGSDMPMDGTINVSGKLAAERYSLTPDECDRYRRVGYLAGHALETTVAKLEPGLNEWEIIGRLTRECYNRALVPFVTLVATDERVFNFRHPIPADKQLEKYAMVVLCAKAGGLIANCTRLVHFGEPSEELLTRHQAVQAIDATYNLSTRPGAKVSDIFKTAQAIYAATGYADEWQLHHQGGATGYDGRDFLGRPDAPEVVQAWQAFAWNPSITGTKSEDTVLIGDNSLEILTSPIDSNWPSSPVTVEGLGTMPRPNILVL